MPAGFMVVNDHGTIQVDENYKNLCLLDKRSGSGDASFTVAARAAPMVAIASTGKSVARIAKTGSTWTVFVRSASTWTTYVFDEPPASTTSTSGLQVFNAAGELTFCSSLKYARVAATRSGATVTAWQGTVTLTTGRTYAWLCHMLAWQVDQEVRQAPGSPTGWYNWRTRHRSSVATISGRNVSFSMQTGTDVAWGEWTELPVQTVPPPPPGRTSFAASIIDVTGY